MTVIEVMAVKTIFWKVKKDCIREKKKCILTETIAFFKKKIGDTYLHSWEVLAEILKSDEAKDMILDIGM